MVGPALQLGPSLALGSHAASHHTVGFSLIHLCSALSPAALMWWWLLLEYLEGDGGVLDGYDDAAVVQVEDVMLLLKHLQTGSDVCGSKRDQRRTGHRLPVSSSAHSRSSRTSPPYTPPALSPGSLSNSRGHVIRTGGDSDNRTDVWTDVGTDVRTDAGTNGETGVRTVTGLPWQCVPMTVV